MKKLLVFASGTEGGGGSGLEKLYEATQNGILNADIIGVVSNHEKGGVYKRADRLGIQFIHFPDPWTAEEYQRIAKESGADFFALSGWLKLVRGLDPDTNFNSKTVFNIHPGPLPSFGGKGMYGHHVHEAVMKAYGKGEITHSAVSMHFVTEGYDEGPRVLNARVEIFSEDTPDTLGSRVNKKEHELQPYVTNLIVQELITWDGIDKNSLIVPAEYCIDC